MPASKSETVSVVSPIGDQRTEYGGVPPIMSVSIRPSLSPKQATSNSFIKFIVNAAPGPLIESET